MRADQEAVVYLMNDHWRLRQALVVIRDMPVPEQDNMISANMRKVAAEALADDRP